MRIVYLIKGDWDETGKTILEEHRKRHQVTVIDLRADADYAAIVRQLEEADRVISW